MFKGTGQFWEFSVTPPQLLVITPPPPSRTSNLSDVDLRGAL